MFFEGDVLIAQEFYNEYLELKQEINSLANHDESQKDIDEKIKRMRFVLKELRRLSIGAELN